MYRAVFHTFLSLAVLLGQFLCCCAMNSHSAEPDKGSAHKTCCEHHPVDAKNRSSPSKTPHEQKCPCSQKQPRALSLKAEKGLGEDLHTGFVYLEVPAGAIDDTLPAHLPNSSCEFTLPFGWFDSPRSLLCALHILRC